MWLPNLPLGSIERWTLASSDTRALELAEVKSKPGYCLDPAIPFFLHPLSSEDFSTRCVCVRTVTSGSASREPGLVQGRPLRFTKVGWSKPIFFAKLSP